MSARIKLVQRREALLVRSNQLRDGLSAQKHAICQSMDMAHIGTSLLATIMQNKLLIAGAALAVVVIKPRRIITGLKAAVVGWQTWRNIVPVLQNFLKRP